MMTLIKIGPTYFNVERIQTVEDLFSRTKEDKLVIRFGPEEGDAFTLSGREADDLRTWLNSIAINLRTPSSDLDTSG